MTAPVERSFSQMKLIKMFTDIKQAGFVVETMTCTVHMHTQHLLTLRLKIMNR